MPLYEKNLPRKSVSQNLVSKYGSRTDGQSSVATNVQWTLPDHRQSRHQPPFQVHRRRQPTSRYTSLTSRRRIPWGSVRWECSKHRRLWRRRRQLITTETLSTPTRSTNRTTTITAATFGTNRLINDSSFHSKLSKLSNSISANNLWNYETNKSCKFVNTCASLKSSFRSRASRATCCRQIGRCFAIKWTVNFCGHVPITITYKTLGRPCRFIIISASLEARKLIFKMLHPK